MRKIAFYGLIAMGLLASCKSVQVAVPAPLQDNAEKYHVVGTGLSVFGHKIKIEGYGEANMYSGFSIGTSDLKRWFPKYFDIDKHLKYVSPFFEQVVDVSKTKYRFDFVSNGIYVNTYCVASSAEAAANVKYVNLEGGIGKSYRFDGLIFTNQDTTPWKLSFDASQLQRFGAGNHLKNVRNNSALLTRDKDTIDVRVVDLNDRPEKSKKRRNLTKKAIAYEFLLNDTTLGFVALHDRDIWIHKNVDPHTRAVLVSAATSILIKINTA